MMEVMEGIPTGDVSKNGTLAGCRTTQEPDKIDMP